MIASLRHWPRNAAVRTLVDRLTRFAEPGRGRLRPGPGAPRIAFVGNCQIEALAQAVAILMPEAAVAYRPQSGLLRAYPRAADLADDLSPFDLVFAGPFPPSFYGGDGLAVLRAKREVRAVPNIVFSAFHPDAIYVRPAAGGEVGTALAGPLGDYHSALALAGFQLGLGVEGTTRLFRAETYAALGYLAMWDSQVAHLLGLGREAGLDLADDVLRWTRRGAFMHVINHPKMFVMCDLARTLLAGAGLRPATVDVEALAADTLLREGAWPVYPEVAELYGVPGSLVFVRHRRRPGEQLRRYTLRGFLEASFALYARTEPARLGSARLDGWRDAPGVWEMLARTGRG